jgi:hypothetical protein
LDAQVFHRCPSFSVLTGLHGHTTLELDMKMRWAAAVAIAVGLLLFARVGTAAEDPSLFRVFLKDGASLVSYGELARVGDRIVFSMPTAASAENPQLQLVNIPLEKIDWERTERYTESVRSSHYVATQAESDYAVLTAEIDKSINDIAATSEPAKRLVIVEKARKRLAEWPAAHFGYRQDEVRQMLGMLDEAIAGLRAAAGERKFDLTFAAVTDAPVANEPLLPKPSPREAIEQTLLAATLSPSASDRVSLLTMVIVNLERDGKALPTDWAWSTRVETQAALANEARFDREYQLFTGRMLGTAKLNARRGDVRAIQRLLTEIPRADASYGRRRPEVITSLIAAVEHELDGARRLQMARERFAMRAGDFRKYRTSVIGPIVRLTSLTSALEDIRSLAGSPAATLATIQRVTAQLLASLSSVVPPDEFKGPHSLLVSSAQLARAAADIRREAVLARDMARAWDASSAAAGALMLSARARTEIETLSHPPQIQQ